MQTIFFTKCVNFFFQNISKYMIVEMMRIYMRLRFIIVTFIQQSTNLLYFVRFFKVIFL